MWRVVFGLSGALLLSTATAWAEPPDAVMNAYLAIWSDNARITPAAVASLYGARVDYYGRLLDRQGVYRDKLGVVRRWPERRYAVVPGTLTKSCDAPGDRCSVHLVLSYRVANRGRAARGRSSLALTLVRQDGGLKIVSESGRPTS